VINSVVAGNTTPGYGGAITAAVGADVELRSTTFADNQSIGGGAIAVWNDTDLEATGCTFVGNSATGGSIYVGWGGAIGVQGLSTRLWLTDCTFSDNHADQEGGALWFAYHTQAFLNGVTIADNTGDNGADGLHVFRATNLVSVEHTIIADDCAFTDGGFLASDGHNLEAGEVLVNTDARLGPLGESGGPTLTHALAADSPAIDAGVADCGRSSDQRGLPRPIDGDGSGTAACDIGAVEYQVPIFYDGFVTGDTSAW